MNSPLRRAHSLPPPVNLSTPRFETGKLNLLPSRMGDTMRATLSSTLILAIGSLSACAAIGPSNVERDRFDYNRVIGASNNQQMLLNIVRMRYRDVPTFMAVSSVLTQYVYTGSLGVNGTTGVANGFDADGVGGSLNLRYFERPTITYAPMTGPEFAAQLLTPIPAELVFTLVNSGWPSRDLLLMTLERINAVQNAPFHGHDGAEGLTVSADFERLVDLIVALGAAGALELQRPEGAATGELVLVEGVDAEADALLAELRALVGLDPGLTRFRVVQNRIGRERDEITIRVRSLLALMGVLSRGVDVQDDRAATVEPGRGGAASRTEVTASNLAVRSSTERPEDEFIAVEYRGLWFYIDDGDLASREAFGLLNYLFLMMASRPEGGGPLITVPVS